MSGLSDTERLTLRNTLLADDDLGLTAAQVTYASWLLKPIVEAIVAARLASVKALLAERDEWLLEDHPKPWPTGTVHSALVTTDEVRAALGSDAHTEQKGAGVWRCDHTQHDTDRCVPTKHYAKDDTQ